MQACRPLKLSLRSAALLLVSVSPWIGCARQPLPSETSKRSNARAEDQEKLPFNQHKKRDGISPSSSLIPSTAEVPTGTPFTIRLKSSISSATADIGDSFEAVLDEAVVVQGRPVFPAGTPVSGTIIALNRSATGGAPAYLRLKATSIAWQNTNIPIESSSIFAKAGLPRAQGGSIGDGNGQAFSGGSPVIGSPRAVRFAAGRRLTFRLTAPAAVPR